MNVVCVIYYIVYVFWYASTNDACIYTFALCLVARWYILDMWYMNVGVYIFLKFVVIFS